MLPPQPIAIHTQGTALTDISIFAGEQLQTDRGGRITLRLGKSSRALAEDSEAMLVRISGGIHGDLAAGMKRFFASESEIVEVHADEATICSQHGQSADATVYNSFREGTAG